MVHNRIILIILSVRQKALFQVSAVEHPFRSHPNLFVAVMNDTAEQSVMLHLHQTYGKTIHTWAFDDFPELPLGPPHLMMSYTGINSPSDDAIRCRDERSGISSSAKKGLREGYLPRYQKDNKADQWETSGTGIMFKPEETQIR